VNFASRRSGRRSVAAGLVAAVVLGAVAVLTVEPAREHGPAVDSSACERSPEAEMASAWSPAQRASLMQRFAGSPDLGGWLDELDGFAARWVREYRSACTSPHGTQIFAKLACLLGERDQVAGFTEHGFIEQLLAPPRSILEANPIGEMPRLEACDGESPVIPAVLPADPVRRAKILALHVKFSRAWVTPREQMLAEMPGLLAEAEALGWDPILAEAHEAFGDTVARSYTRWELARDHIQKAIQLALRSHDYRSEATLWARRLWCEYHAASEPANPEHVGYLIEQAYVAVHHAGDNPLKLARIQWPEAYIRWSADHVHDDTLARLRTARTLAVSGRDFVFATEIASSMAGVLADRNRPGDLGAAWQLLVDTLSAATAGGISEVKLRDLPDLPWFPAASRVNAFLRGDLAVAHAWDDRVGGPKSPDGAVALRGRVIDLHGNAVAGATVVAWSGTLEGDATRAYLRVPEGQDPHATYTGTAPPAYHRAGFEADVASHGRGGARWSARPRRLGGGNQRGPPGRDPHRELAQREQRQAPHEQELVGQARDVVRIDEVVVDGERQRHAQHHAGHPEQAGFGHELCEELLARRAERAAHADLVRALRDPEAGQTEDAERRDHQQPQTYRGEQPRQRALLPEELVALCVHRALVDDRDAGVSRQQARTRLRQHPVPLGRSCADHVMGTRRVGHTHRHDHRVF
jgi:hypothetical protein